MNIAIDDKLTAKEVVDLRELNGWDHDESEWEKCLKQNLLNVSARNADGEVVGVGFLCGNMRHAELVDLVVHPEYRQHGIGREISKLIIDYALSNRIKYFGLTYNKNFPWLKDFYESEGFQLIDFALWHKSSLKYRGSGNVDD
jgi:GNAT superfamily N-acetyltransferase